MRRRWISLLLCLCLMICGILPAGAKAAKVEPQVLQSREWVDNITGAWQIDYRYDESGRCVLEIWTSKSARKTVEYTYEEGYTPKTKAVRLDGVLIEECSYDAMGNLQEQRLCAEDGKLQKISKFTSTYDADGNLVKRVEQWDEGGEIRGVEECWTYQQVNDSLYRVGDTLFLGHFEQDGIAVNGPEPVQWRVLKNDWQKDQLLLISVQGLDSRRFHDAGKSVSWKNCDLRDWLNGEFYQGAFSSGERDAIRSVRLEDSEDQVFLLSLEEAEKLFDGDSDRICRATPYALSKGAYVKSGTGGSWWLLRSSGKSGSQVAAVYSDGRLDTGSTGTGETGGVIRPAMWVTLEGRTKPVVQEYTVTDYTQDKGKRSEQIRERYVYDDCGNPLKYFEGDEQIYEYDHTYHLGNLIHTDCTIVTQRHGEHGQQIETQYTYDQENRLIRKLSTFDGGSGYTDDTWEYDDQGRLWKHSDEYKTVEANHYGPLSQVLQK